jgi:hypothetical protein
VLAELIGLLISQIPTVVVHEGTKGWVEPDWNRQQRLQLFGIVSATQGAPVSFATSSNPTDIMRVAVWLNACYVALSKPDRPKDVIGTPLPLEIGGCKSASKYILKTMQGLKAGQTSDDVLSAVSTLDILLKLWIKNQWQRALALVRKQKISWGTVLLDGAPTEKKKVKGKEVIQVLTPLKPSRSPWLTGTERTALGKLFSDEWSSPERLRKDWNALSARQQHTQYHTYVQKVKTEFERMKSISSSVHARLGHRKKWIYDAVKAAQKAPKKKNDKANPFAWTSIFYKLDLATSGLAVKMVFSPSHYLVDKQWETDVTLSNLWHKAMDREDHSLSTDDIRTDDVTADLWKFWVLMFEPQASHALSALPDSAGITADNKFAALPIENTDGDDDT